MNYKASNEIIFMIIIFNNYYFNIFSYIKIMHANMSLRIDLFYRNAFKAIFTSIYINNHLYIITNYFILKRNQIR